MLDGRGNPVVSYRDLTTNALKMLHCGDPNCSSGNVITSPDTAGSGGWSTSLVLDDSGNPVVSFFERDTGRIKVLRCGDPNCSSGNVIASPDTAQPPYLRRKTVGRLQKNILKPRLRPA